MIDLGTIFDGGNEDVTMTKHELENLLGDVWLEGWIKRHEQKDAPDSTQTPFMVWPEIDGKV